MFLSVFLAGMLWGCNKTSEDELQPLPPAGDYLPLTENSYWRFAPAEIVAICDNFNFTSVVTSVNPTHMGNAYRLIRSSINNPRVGNLWDTLLFRKQNTKYFEALYPHQLPIPITQTDKELLEFVVMEDGARVGTSWSNSITGINHHPGGSIQLRHTINTQLVDYKPTYTIEGGTVYNDVVQIAFEVKTAGLNAEGKEMWVSFEYYDNWYAKNIGLIKMRQNSGPWEIKLSNCRIF